MNRIGFFGGCFNPPTIAHIQLANEAIKIAKLDKVIFVPMGNCYNKNNLIDFEHRYNMLKIATKNEEKLEVSNMQKNQKENTCAIDSFKKINQKYNCISFFILGEDNYNKIINWKDYEELKKYNYIILKRSKKKLKKILNNIIVVDVLEFKDINSSKIRENINSANLIKNIINNDVLEYIQENKLYKGKLV